MSKRIPLTQGQYAIVDDEDYDWLRKWKWYAHKDGNNFYAVRNKKAKERFPRQMVMMHREIMNPPAGKETDHIKGSGLDNRRCNLRACTHQQNLRNQKKRKNKTSQYKGVFWHSREKKWYVSVTKDYKPKIIGRFIDEIKAAEKYDEIAKNLFGKFARLNFPD